MENNSNPLQLVRQMPSAVEMEEAVIGAVMIDANAYALVKDLEAGEFYDQKNRYVWEAVCALKSRQQPCDMISVMQEMMARSSLDAAGGPARLADLTNVVSSAYDVKYYASVVSDMAVRRMMITEMSRYQTMLYSHSVATKEVARQMQYNIATIVRTESIGSVYVVDPEHPSPPTEFLLDIKGVECFPRRDITAFKAKAKNGKTQLGAIAVAAIIAKTEMGDDGVLKPKPVCGVRRVRTEPLKVLMVDTEQSYSSSDKLTRRILTMAGYEWNKRCDYLTVCNLRLQKKGSRLEYIVQEVERGGYDMVLIDGIKDLAKDFNDNNESDIIIEETLLPLMQKTGINITSVLHENPSKDSNKMRGHLGTELCNKSFEVFQVSADKESGVFNVDTSERREQDVPTWAFKFNDESVLEEATPSAKSSGSQGQGQNGPTKEEKKWLQFVKAWEQNYDLAMTKEEIVQAHLRIGSISEATCKNRIKEYIAQKRIIAYDIDNGRGTRYGLAPDERTAITGGALDINSGIWVSAGSTQVADDELPF